MTVLTAGGRQQARGLRKTLPGAAWGCMRPQAAPEQSSRALPELESEDGHRSITYKTKEPVNYL